MSMCQYGSCDKYVDKAADGIGVNGGGYRARFCSWLHASLWALQKAEQTAVTDEERTRLQVGRFRLEGI